MNTTQHLVCATAIMGASLIAPAVAAGQSATGATRLGGLVSGSIGAGNSAITVGMSASYRFAPRLAVFRPNLRNLKRIGSFVSYRF